MTEYGGRTKEVKGKIIDVTEKNDYDYEVIAEYYPQEYYLETKLYTQKFIVSTRNSGGDSENSAGGGNAGGGNSGRLRRGLAFRGGLGRFGGLFCRNRLICRRGYRV